MTEQLKPCPFCGHTGLQFESGSTYRWGIASCAGCGATCGEVRRNYPDDGKWHAEAIEEWNRRAQPAQAVRQGQCGECGKKASDGWALYCVKCMESVDLGGQKARIAELEAEVAALRKENGKLRELAGAIQHACHTTMTSIGLDRLVKSAAIATNKGVA